ncbi:MAG: hypothetical protein ACE37K_00740 [Planctomycetota bacterium]
MTIPKEYEGLVQKLINTTTKKQARWHEWRGGVVLWLGSSGVHLWEGEGSDGAEFVALGIVEKPRNRRQRILIDSFSIEGTPDELDDYIKLVDLLHAAKRGATGIDKRLEEIEKALERTDGAVGDPEDSGPDESSGESGVDYGDIPF